MHFLRMLKWTFQCVVDYLVYVISSPTEKSTIAGDHRDHSQVVDGLAFSSRPKLPAKVSPVIPYLRVFKVVCPNIAVVNTPYRRLSGRTQKKLRGTDTFGAVFPTLLFAF